MNINFLASVFGRFYTKVRILFTHHCKNDFCGIDLQSNQGKSSPQDYINELII